MGRSDSFKVHRTLNVNGRCRCYGYYSLAAVEAAGLGPVSRLPPVLKVVLENLLRHEDGEPVTADDIAALAAWPTGRRAAREIAFRPSRVMMPDSSGIPLLADFAAMRDAVARLGGDPRAVNPAIPVDFIVDHSVMVDVAGRADALERNIEFDYARNGERYTFLRWCQGAFEKLRVVPPRNGICHQVNLEYLGHRGGQRREPGPTRRLPGQPARHRQPYADDQQPRRPRLGRRRPRRRGHRPRRTGLHADPRGRGLPPQRLPGGGRDRYRPGAGRDRATARLWGGGQVRRVLRSRRGHAAPLSARATLANMAPKYGATIAFFPIDAERPSATSSSPVARPSASPWSRPTARLRACGTMSTEP